jgi:hypothetical protein
MSLLFGITRQLGSGENLFTSSENFASGWAATRSNLTSDAVTGPIGGRAADKLYDDATAANSHYIAVNPNKTIVANIPYCFSIFCKAAEYTDVQLFAGTGNPYSGRRFDLTDGTTSAETQPSVNDAPYYGTTSYGNGWYRCYIGFTAPSTSCSLRVLLDNGVDDMYNGNGASGIYIFGAQLNKGYTPTIYIPKGI